MRRPLKIMCAAGAAIAAGGTVWAIASSDMLGRYIQTSTSTHVDMPRGAQEKAPAAAAAPKRVPDGASATRSREALAIEVARIEAGGASVFAGRSPPKHRVTVLANGRELATAVASEEGQWSIVLDGGISAGPVELTIKSSPEAGGPIVVGAPHQIIVPERAGEQRVAVAPAGRFSPPAGIVSAPSAAVAPKSAPAPQAASAPALSQKSATAPAASAPSSSAKSDEAADARALERFAAMVERARTAAANGRSDGGPGQNPQGAPAVVTGPSVPQAMLPGSVPPTAVAAAPRPAFDPTESEPGRVAMTTAHAAPIPVPITFVTGETTLTGNGAKAAALLAEYLRLKRPGGISLSGHADSRGPDRYNMELSRRRLEAIERYLRTAGYTGGLILLPKGESEPYQGIDRARVSRQDVHQADRRVELRLTQ